jgi:hypothetical protein
MFIEPGSYNNFEAPKERDIELRLEGTLRSYGAVMDFLKSEL